MRDYFHGLFSAILGSSTILAGHFHAISSTVSTVPLLHVLDKNWQKRTDSFAGTKPTTKVFLTIATALLSLMFVGSVCKSRTSTTEGCQTPW